MPLSDQNDVANSGVLAGRPLRFAGITCSALPTGKLASKGESFWVPPHSSASGLNIRYTDKFTHHIALT